jgi:hypothetical protein
MPSGYYSSPATMTALPEGLGSVPGDPDNVRMLIPTLFVHTAWAPAYGLDAVALDARQSRTAHEMLAAIRSLDDAPLSVARPPEKRAGVVCRHFSTLAVAMLRDAGVPARARCGFATYFQPGKYIDHWIVEWHDGDRWVQIDCQLDELQRNAIGNPFDPADLPPGAFLNAGEAWQLMRTGAADPDIFGIFEFWGAWFIRANVARDLAALNKVEMLPWDTWGTFGDLADDEVDALAALVVGDDLDAIRSRYENDDGLRVGDHVTSFTERGPVEETVSV